MPRSGLVSCIVLASIASAQDERSGPASSDNQHTPEALLAALAGDDETRAQWALATILYRISPLPDQLFHASSSEARDRLAIGLAERPRRAAVPHLRRQIDDGLLGTVATLAALRALAPAQWTEADLERIEAGLRAKDPSVHSAAYNSSRLLPADLSDARVDVLLEHLNNGATVETILPLIDRMSDAGQRRMLEGHSPKHPAWGEIFQFLARTGSIVVVDIIQAALDGEDEIPLPILRQVGHQVLTPAHTERLLCMLAPTGTPDDEERSYLAFAALAPTGLEEPRMEQWIEQNPDPSSRPAIHRWIHAGGDTFSIALWQKLLRQPNEALRILALRALAERDLPTGLAEAVFALALSDPSPQVQAASVRTIGAAGDRGLIQALWLSGGDPLRLALIDALRLRQRPWLPAFLTRLAEQVAAKPDASTAPGPVFVQLQLVRAQLGAKDASRFLFDHFEQLHGPTAFAASDAISAILRTEDTDRLRRWLWSGQRHLQLASVRLAADRPDLPLATDHFRLLKSTTDQELASELRQVLFRSEHATELLAPLLELGDRPATVAETELAFEALGAKRPPLAPLDIEWIARVLLQGAEDKPRRKDFRMRGVEYPIHLLIHELLRIDEGADLTPILALAEQRRAAGSRGRAHRVLHFLSLCASTPHLRTTLGPPLARLVLSDSSVQPEFKGPALLLLAESERDQALAAGADLPAEMATDVAQAFAAALTAWIDDPPPAALLRAFLSDTDVSAGQIPLARVAAESHLFAARAASDPLERASAMAIAEDLAFGDHMAERRVQQEQRR